MAVGGYAHRIGPEDARVVGEGFGQAGLRVPAMDGIGDRVGHVDVAGGVGFETIRGHLAGDDAYGAGDLRVGLGAVAQHGRGDGVELGPVDRAVVERFSVAGDGDAVRGEVDGLGRVVRRGLV